MIPLVLSLALAAESPDVPRLVITLAQAQDEALEHSPKIRSARSESRAASQRGGAAFSYLLPKLSLEGSLRYTEPIPVISFGPGPGRPFGDLHSRSLDAVAGWTVWDNGATFKAWKGIKRSQDERTDAELLAHRQVLLSVRLAYAQLGLSLEQVRLLTEGLGVALGQYRDIQNRLGAGSSSRLDSLSAHQEVLARRRQLQEAQLQLASSLRDLLQLMAHPEDYDLSLVLPPAMDPPPPAEAGRASLILVLDGFDQALAGFRPAETLKPDLAHPAIRALKDNQLSREAAASGLKASRGPILSLSGRAGRDYPNGPELETVTLRSAGLALRFPLFEGRKTLYDAREQQALAEASGIRAEGAAAQVVTEWRKARDNLAGRRKTQVLDQQAAQETEELASLVYEAYKAGRRGFIDVENANLRALEAKVQAARTGAQILMDAAQLDYNSEAEQ